MATCEGSVKPSPVLRREDLPLPPSALVHDNLHGRAAVYLGAGDAKVGMELARDHVDDDDDDELHTVSLELK